MAGAWTKVSVRVKVSDIDRTASIVSMLDSGIMIEDFSDFSLNGMYGELVDESILSADREHGVVSVFVPEEKELSVYTEYIKTHLPKEGIEYELTLDGVREEDWADSWKSHYKPQRIGNVTIVPSWEDYTPDEGEHIIRLDPGMAFGTGTHETTRLVIRLLQRIDLSARQVLDVGCGSGILSIVASVLGAEHINAYDIDPVAVRVAEENVTACGLDNIEVGTSDLLAGVKQVRGGYGVLCANIVAEIIVRMLPDAHLFLTADAPVILSGIVVSKENEVLECARRCGYRVIDRECENDWVALTLVRGS
ncbi:MAG: 50S ribosomal protein L11 methyltransferase [Clostridia bacterium]|nr:50S ribosomal protein L11 methyltransferase [Clostridia bacterium]